MNIAFAIVLFVIAAIFLMGTIRAATFQNPHISYQPSMLIPSLVISAGISIGAIIGGIVLLTV